MNSENGTVGAVDTQAPTDFNKEAEVAENVISEGPILISTTAVKGITVMNQLKDEIVDAVLKGHLKNEEKTRVLILSGSHGDGESGNSGLSDIEKLKDVNDEQDGQITNRFYVYDCIAAGLTAQPMLDIQNLPIPEKSIPDITKMTKLSTFIRSQSLFLTEKTICNITFQVVNIAYYHNHPTKLVEDIEKFDPKVLALAWCYSFNGDVCMALRRKAVFSKMILEAEMREIGIKDAKLSFEQKKFLDKATNPENKDLIIGGKIFRPVHEFSQNYTAPLTVAHLLAIYSDTDKNVRVFSYF